MIISLRRRVFWSILLSAAGVLLTILMAINALQLVRSASKQDSILESAAMMLRQDGGTERGGMRGGRGRADLLRSVSENELGVVLLDESGQIVTSAGCASQMDDGDVSAVIFAALADTDGRGRANGWEYRAFSLPEGTAVSFLDAASLREENAETAILSLAGFAAAAGLFALMARLLSRAIVKPVEENMQAQKRFIADASHELKTPLTVIDANVSVLEQSVAENKWLGYIRDQTERMSALVNELLQLSRLEEDPDASAPRQRERFDAAEAVLMASLPFESVAFERGVALETDVPDTLEAYGDRKDLEQLAAILIDNAVKHSAEGETVRVRLRKTAVRHGWKEEAALELSVTDSGDGIPPEALPHIFDRFYRVDASRERKGNSYGLGLAIARGLAEKNGGTIAASSRDGLTEFTFRMPAG